MKEVFGDVMNVIEGLSLSKEMLSPPQYLHSFHFVLSGICETYIYNNV